jgi:hypothetical protein
MTPKRPHALTASRGAPQDLRAEEFVELYGQGFMRVLKGKDNDGNFISCLLPAKMSEIADATIFMRWNLWVLSEVLMDMHLQVGAPAGAAAL